MRDTIQQQLNDSRRELLDLSSRNRLISMPIGATHARVVEVHDEKGDETFKKLIREKKPFSFLPGLIAKRAGLESKGNPSLSQPENQTLAELPLPEDDEIDAATGLARRHTDTKLQTRLGPEVLQRKLFDLYNESRMLIEEQGVNVLYLAIGFVKWIDKTNGSTPRYAPLLLIPVDLFRKSAAEKFAMKWREEDLQENLSLAEKFRIECDVFLPPLSIDDPEGFEVGDYFSKVEQAIGAMPGWEVDRDGMCLGFFSFAKFLMYRDLDATTWPAGKSIVDHPLIRRLLLTRQEEVETASATDLAVDRLDDTISVDRLDHIVDADSSQTVAIELVRMGRDLVIQGPPGTGKSQTITNIIATAVLDGKKVLFVAEKLAALEVVKRRLEKEQLGVLCLELHSNKARKTDMAHDLKLTWDLGKPAAGTLQDLNAELEKQRTSLNQHPQRLHRPLGTLKQSAFDFIGLLAKEGRPEGKEIGLAFSGAESWSQEQTTGYREQLKELQLRQLALGDLQRHPWRGVRQTVYFGTERPLLLEKLKAWQENTVALRALTFTIQERLHTPATEVTVPQTERLQQWLQWAFVHPTEKIASIAHPVWDDAGSTILKLAQNKARFEAIATELKSQVLPSVWKGNLGPVRQQIVLNGQRWYRFLIGSYRKALSELQAQLSIPLPNRYAERLALVDPIMEGQQAFQYLESKVHTAREAFGLLWEADGNGPQLVAIAEWMQAGIARGFGSAERQAAYQADRETTARLSRQYAQLLDQHQVLSAFFREKLQIDWSVYNQQAPETDELTLSQRAALLQEWLDQPDALVDWIAWQKQLKMAQNGPLAPLVSLAEQGYLPAKRLLVSFNRIWASQCLEHLFRQEEALADFDGGSHEKKIEQFRQLDKQRLHLSKVKVLDAHYGRIPEKRAVGMVGTVLGEVNKQRNHKPIRKLLKEAGAVIQNLKPVFMMSPLSVAQYLEPGAIEFDLLVIDEASQVQPVDALGAVARARQIVVVGDDKQLPPTMFFSKITSNDEGGQEDEAEEAGQVKAKELESILSLCKARGVPDTLLQWHYRSRHESLIAVSNQRYYENKLFIVPSPWKKNAGLGLKWHAVNGVYDRSNTRSNPIEAKEVALAVLNHARQHPEQTLGVAAFSMTQQRAIQDEVEVLRRSHAAEMEPFFAKHAYEPFFVKNLENVQGDERDVIFLSVGYGKDAEGRMFQNFGPLNKAGCERRLNVLISRARRCCEVFTSITDQDITLTETPSEGVVGLKHFLQYARTGIFDLAQASGRPLGSPLEEAVKEAIERNLGREVHTQVGVAGFFIDLALIDPERPGRYVLGIECDGVAYHSSPSARERDRLRQSVLESQGWLIHRLWGLDFFRRPDQEIAKIKAAYDRALEHLKEADALEVVKPAAEWSAFQLVRETEQKSDFTVPYQTAPDIRLPDPDPYNVTLRQLAEVIHHILRAEAPIHFDELVTRTREQWGLGRAAERFRNHVKAGLQVLEKENVAVWEGEFIHLTHQEPVRVRKRSEDAPPGTRKCDHIPSVEIDLALRHVTRLAHRLSREEAAKEVSLALGFKSLSSEFRGIVEERINQLIHSGQMTEAEGKLGV